MSATRDRDDVAPDELVHARSAAPHRTAYLMVGEQDPADDVVGSAGTT